MLKVQPNISLLSLQKNKVRNIFGWHFIKSKQKPNNSNKVTYKTDGLMNSCSPYLTYNNFFASPSINKTSTCSYLTIPVTPQTTQWDQPIMHLISCII